MTALAQKGAGLTPPPRTRRAMVLSFTGYFHEEDGLIFAASDHAGVVTHGANEDEALKSMPFAIGLYLRTLQERGEIDLAIRVGKLPIRLAEIDPAEWTTPLLSKTDGRWIVEMAAF